VTLSVRPECWRITPEPAGGNCIRGRIGKSVYLGENAQYDFESGGTSLKILELNPRFVGRTDLGDVFAGAEAADVVVLAD
jgi:iron(III) transport system ATP-binding protein